MRRALSAASLALCVTLLVVLATRADAASCPDASAGETQQDCPWAGAARALIAEADRPGGDVDGTFSRLLPELDARIREDAKRAELTRLWGRSINFDEFAKGIIVHPEILKVLAQRLRIQRIPMDVEHVRAEKPGAGASAELKGAFAVPATDPAGHPLAHAGMEHTYGYLFSLLKTSFGYKRARWVEGEIARGFGLPEVLLGPKPSQGTLLWNITYLAGNIAFRDSPARLSVLKHMSRGLPCELLAFDFGSLKPVRVEETVTAKDAFGQPRQVILRTDLVPFPKPQKNTHLLVYSVQDPSAGGAQLITAFPVEKSFVDTVLKPEGLGEDKPVQTRYNAFVEGVTGATLTGSRKVVK